ncbi:hypothetical protein C9374_005213 [Naegleria lovaniensis]|uniref:Uncharacterized protein n=1 Tax=Naegleria lovaniensis TaxID=51637 RepID=A0AA88GR47_NAELO|nr:uncharacterized protein C9374_005213 [Naegleria lovaniensis]KAG2382633.1 hypothetical protein C9374_005213 [Naegleria lovaniensis]
MLDVVMHVLYCLLLAGGGFMGYSRKGTLRLRVQILKIIHHTNDNDIFQSLITSGSLPSLFGGLIIALLFLYAAYLFYVKNFEIARTVSMIASFVLFGLGAFRFVSVEKKALPVVFMVMGIVMLVMQWVRRSGDEDAKFK